MAQVAVHFHWSNESTVGGPHMPISLLDILRQKADVQLPQLLLKTVSACEMSSKGDK